MMDSKTYLLIVISVLNAALGLFLLRKASRTLESQIFSITAGSTALWTLTNAIFRSSTNITGATLAAETSYVAAVIISVSFFCFSRSFLSEKENFSTLPWKILFISTFVIGAVSYVPSFSIYNIGVDTSGSRYINTGFWVLPIFLTVGIFFISGIYILARKYFASKATDRKQIGFILSGTALSIIFGGTLNLILPLIKNYSYVWLGPVASIIFIAFTSYAIVAYRLFDIRLIVRRTVVYSILLTTLFSAYSLLIFLFAQVFSLQQVGQNEVYLNFFVTLIVGLSFDPLRRWLQEKTDKFLYRKEYEQQSVLKTLSSDLNNVIGLDEALETVMQTIVRTLKIQHAITYVFQPGEGGSIQIKRIKQIGFSTEKNLLLQERDFVIEYFNANGRTISRAQLEAELNDESRLIRHSKPEAEGLSDLIREHARKQTMVKRLADLDCEVAVPLHLGAQSIGLLLLSGKLSQDRYGKSDLQLLDLAGEVAISSIQKARLYEGDQMKSEFVSIASHELLTPISAIEGYLSMILEEHIGTVDEQARGYLEKVYVSSRRLSQLVKDLLSVSRIESGKMTVNPQAVDMQKMIHDTMDQLRFIAQKKGLELNYEAPARPLPMVRADPDRVMQILINLVSNAIKYTPRGSVSLHASRPRRGILKIDVSDTGLGLTKEQRLHLFEKFYRVDSSDTVGIVGTGLGLYITKSILERMGGTIAVESIPKRGSTFSITLPIFEAEASLPVA